MSGFARFILVNYKQDLLGENIVDNTVDQKIALPFYVMLMLHIVIYKRRAIFSIIPLDIE